MGRCLRRCLLVAMALLGVAALPSTSVAQQSAAVARGPHAAGGQASAVKRAGFAKTLVRDLRKRGFQVSQGYAKLWTPPDCDRYTFPILRTCMGNNPAGAYVAPIVKSWKDEFVDPAMVNVLGKTRRGYSATHRFDPREAIVVLGKLPPRARYMGLQTWVWTRRWLSDDQPWLPAAYAGIQARAPELVHYLFNTVPRNPSRVLSFSTLSNNINNVVIKRQSGAAFGRTRYFITTPDRVMDGAVRRSLRRLGVRTKDVFTEAIPPAHPLGLGEAADDFLTMMRYAQPNSKRAADAWLRTVPLTVLRVRAPRSSHRPRRPFAPFVADKRSAAPENVYASDLDSLVSRVCQRWGQPCDAAHPNANRLARMLDLQVDLGDFGPQCRAINMDCLGDGQDASYFIAPGRALDPGWVYAIVGTLATATRNATYVGLSVNDLSKLKGVLNIPDTKLARSAAPYAATVNNTDKFFVHYFTRDCKAIKPLTGGHCTAITTDQVPPRGRGTRGLMSVGLRSYVRPGTARGPLSSAQLRPLIIRFARP